MAGAAFLAGADLAVVFEAVFVDLLDVDDFEPEFDDLPAVVLGAEPDDLPAVVFEPVDLLAEVFDVEPEDLAAPVLAAGFAEDLLAVGLEVVVDELLAEVDFPPVCEPEDLLAGAALVGAAFLVGEETVTVTAGFLFADGAALVIAVFLFVVVDFVALLVGFFVAIFFSLKCLRTNFTKTGLKQTHERIFTRIFYACQDIFSLIESFARNKLIIAEKAAEKRYYKKIKTLF